MTPPPAFAAPRSAAAAAAAATAAATARARRFAPRVVVVADPPPSSSSSAAAAATPPPFGRCRRPPAAAAVASPFFLVRRSFSSRPSSSSSAAAAPLRRPPASIASIPSGTVRRPGVPRDSSALPGPISASSDDASLPSAALRDVGCTRRLFLLRPYLTSDELSGLSYRIRTLGKNGSINSILIGNTDDDDVAQGLIPTCAIDVDRANVPIVDEPGWSDRTTGYGRAWFVHGGYDPLELYRSGMHRDEGRANELLQNVSDLALSTRGDRDGPDGSRSRVPVIAVPHGRVVDGGYALCASSYVLATRDSSFRITAPARGLSFDPVGFSYVLPRLGYEFNQPSASYPVGKLLALTGAEANASDMMETGLATHYLDGPIKIGTLERILSELPPWDQQALLKNPTRAHGSRRMGSDPWEDEREDMNRVYKNVAVANAIHACTVYDARGRDVWGEVRDPECDGRGEDPSIVLERESAAGEFVKTRNSDLVNVAATFEDALNSESLAELIERFKEIRSGHERGVDPDEREVGALANDAIVRMERRCPLALRATFRLLEMGSGDDETLESCMERERKVQSKLLKMEDFERWGERMVNSGVKDPIDVSEDDDEMSFRDWKHASVEDVTNDEVAELLEE